MPASVRVTLLSLLAIALSCAAGVALAQDPDTIRRERDAAAAQEQHLSADVSRLDAIAAKVQKQLATLEQRRAEVQADLDRDQARLDLIQQDLRAERARLARLRKRLAQAREMLAERLLTRYKAPDVDVVSVVLNATSFANLLERADFLKRIQQNDQEILVTVRDARADAAAETTRLAQAEDRQEEIVQAMTARRNAVASMAEAVAARKETLLKIRAARAAALAQTRSNRRHLDSRLRAAEAALARAAFAGGGASNGPWAIPWPIVQCESGGQNLPPNSAGASGYYQIMPATWKGLGGKGPHAYLRPKAEQDAAAAKLWNGGRGASNWVCAGLVG